MKLRLLLFGDCDRRCQKCCNKDWDLDALPVCENYAGYSEILLTGGEPLLKPDVVKRVVSEIRAQSDAPIYLYTAKTDDVKAFIDTLFLVDGMTVTLHRQKDLTPFVELDKALESCMIMSGKSMRLKTFAAVSMAGIEISSCWQHKDGIKWIPNCPLPKDEVFMRVKGVA